MRKIGTIEFNLQEDELLLQIYIVRASECQNGSDIVASDAEEKPEKKRKTNDGTKIEKSAEVSATRRSLRKKGN